jgi:thymidylate synthase
MSLTLFQPDKYKVHTGNGLGAGLCTVWNNPEFVFEKSEAVRQHAALVGSLYSRQGVSVIIRNLALNPSIRRLYLWGFGPLSNTQYGLAGRSVLDAVWKNGIEEGGIVKGTHLKIEKELDVATVEKIRSSVELVDVSTLSFQDMEQRMASDKVDATAYMDSHAFPDPVQEAVDTFPSETVGFAVHGRGLMDAWLRAIERIMRYGTVKGSQYGMRQRELIGLSWIFGNEDPAAINLSIAEEWPQELRELVGATSRAITEYQAQLLSPELPDGMSYTYGNRLFAHAGGSRPINQIEELIITQLKSSPDARRTAVTTLIPEIDTTSKEPPCLTHVQALQSRGELHLMATFRSHDMFKAAVANAAGLRVLQQRIANAIELPLGKLMITSNSAHIYEPDWEPAKKLMQCTYWERTASLAFDPATQADPRGMVVLRVDGDLIKASVNGPDGTNLLELEANSGKALVMKLAQLDLFSRSDHWLDIGMEIQKAEIARAKKIAYTQDRPLEM